MNRTQIPGAESIHIHMFPTELHTMMKKLAKVISAVRRKTVFEYELYRDAVERYLASIDLATGSWKLQPVVVPLFYDAIDINSFVNDADLIRIMDHSRMMLWLAAPDNACLHVSPALVRHTGRSAAEFLGMGWAKVIPAEERESTIQNFLQGFRTRCNFIVNYQVRRYDGQFSRITDYAQPRFRPNGQFAGYIGTMHEFQGAAVPMQMHEQAPGLWLPVGITIPPSTGAEDQTVN